MRDVSNSSSPREEIDISLLLPLFSNHDRPSTPPKNYFEQGDANFPCLVDYDHCSYYLINIDHEYRARFHMDYLHCEKIGRGR
jgi:hypothetical protein